MLLIININSTILKSYNFLPMQIEQIEQLYKILLQRNLFNQTEIIKFAKRIQNKGQWIQRNNKVLNCHFPSINKKTKTIPDIIDKKQLCSRQQYANNVAKRSSEITIAQKTFMKLQKVSESKSSTHIYPMKKFIKQKTCYRQNYETSKSKQSNSMTKDLKIPLNLNNIVFHNKTQKKLEPKQIIKGKNRKNPRRQMMKQFMLCSQTYQETQNNQYEVQIMKLFNKDKNLMGYINSSLENLYNKKILKYDNNEQLMKVHAISIMRS